MWTAAGKPADAGTRPTVAPRFPNLFDPDDPAVVEALTRECDQCKQPAGALCVNHIRPNHPLPGRLIHFGRLR